jgi:hypothetical protein
MRSMEARLKAMNSGPWRGERSSSPQSAWIGRPLKTSRARGSAASVPGRDQRLPRERESFEQYAALDGPRASNTLTTSWPAV